MNNLVVLSRLRKNEYRDSVFLMRIAANVAKTEGVLDVAILNGSDENKKTLEHAKLLEGELEYATTDDIMIAVRANTASVASNAITDIERLFAARAPEILMEEYTVASTLASALSMQPLSNWVQISIPGQFVNREALRAIRANLNIMIFSSNVPLADEIEIKRLASERGVLVMGPDCGTAIIGGIGFGFANKVRRGPIGVVGASGTGIQEIISIIDKEGSGITQVIGTGTNDVSVNVGGVMMLRGLQMLDQDNDTKAIVVVSKPPSVEVQAKIVEAATRCHKPVIMNFLGGLNPKAMPNGPVFTRTLEEAALQALATIQGKGAPADPFTKHLTRYLETAKSEYSKLQSDQRYVRGLFAGGTFCNEACMVLTNLGLDVYTNTGFPAAKKLEDTHDSVGNTLLDMGAEEFTSGKPHPMIEPSMRESRMMQEAKNTNTAVILLDFVLGYGAHHDPVGAFAEAIRQAREISKKKARYLPIVASVCGTEADPQRLDLQIGKLKNEGVVVMPSNAQAAKMAGLIACRGKGLNLLVGR